MQGLTLLDRDQIVAAAACFSRFSRIQQAAGNVRGQAEARYYLAIVRLKQGRHAVAVRFAAAQRFRGIISVWRQSALPVKWACE